MHHLREPAFGEQVAHAGKIACHVGEALPAPPERRKLRPCLLGLRPQRLCQFLVAHPFDAGGEGLEQLERHLFRRVIGRVGWAGLEIGLGVGRAILPAVNDLLGYACEIAGDGFGKATAERPFGAVLLKRRRAVAIEEIFERGQAL